MNGTDYFSYGPVLCKTSVVRVSRQSLSAGDPCHPNARWDFITDPIEILFKPGRQIHHQHRITTIRQHYGHGSRRYDVRGTDECDRHGINL